ncbi:hypothetical protein LCGC14_1846810 [marine sediment metagenome]|uniref:Uncharacterized protein n=1 Tax=marine sediment metagenome TaxID=412755 RepID=A0A0F9GBT0_9ZZZZ
MGDEMHLAIVGADCPHLVVGEYADARMWTVRLVALGPPSLRDGIGHVFFLCPGAQVLGVHTPWMIAAVHDYLAVRDQPVVQCPRDAMSRQDRPLAAYPELAVAGTADSAAPRPAPIGNLGQTPKPYIDW